MMTPQQFREKARQNLADARALLPTSAENAAYLAGYAVEFVLKARYCSLRKWPQFPVNVSELKKWNERDGVEMKDKLFVHDLEALLRLSDTVQLKTLSFQRIDWDRACDWSEQIRYQPVASIAYADAEALITEVEKVVNELIIFEVLQVLCSIEIDLSLRYGLFHCFGLVIHPETKQWVLLVAWCARNNDEWHTRECELVRQLDELLAPDLRGQVTDIQTFNSQAPLLKGLYVMFGVLGGGAIAHSPRSILTNNIVDGYPKLPDGFIITAGNWLPESLEKSWAEATALNGGPLTPSPSEV